MAVSITVDQLRAEIETDLPDAILTRKRGAARSLIERYAPAAPAGVQNEACCRMVAWLIQRPAAAVRSESGADSAEYAAGHLSALRHSGAMALLSPFKVRRGGVI